MALRQTHAWRAFFVTPIFQKTLKTYTSAEAAFTLAEAYLWLYLPQKL
jgi:hypothetical protein